MNADDITEELGNQRVYGFGCVTTEQGPRTIKAGGIHIVLHSSTCLLACSANVTDKHVKVIVAGLMQVATVTFGDVQLNFWLLEQGMPGRPAWRRALCGCASVASRSRRPCLLAGLKRTARCRVLHVTCCLAILLLDCLSDCSRIPLSFRVRRARSLQFTCAGRTCSSVLRQPKRFHSWMRVAEASLCCVRARASWKSSP